MQLSLTYLSTSNKVSAWHLLEGANLSAHVTMDEEHWALNSGSAVPKNAISSRVMVRWMRACSSSRSGGDESDL